jgi:hypothetical protein
MEKIYWFEVFEETEDGTETIETFDTEVEALNYIEEHADKKLYHDVWQMNSDGSCVEKINKLI